MSMHDLIKKHGGYDHVIALIGVKALEGGAEGYECYDCGEMAVCGASELWVCLA